MSDDLIKRLRNVNFWESNCEVQMLAADRIEELEREQTRLRTQCDGLMQAGMNNGQALILAEAKLAKAVEALRDLRDKFGLEGGIYTELGETK
jgi:hypothetical protein